MISEISKHRRSNREPIPADESVDKLGPDGLLFGPHEFRLGTLYDLNSRRDTCPFCSLAVTSLNDQKKWFIQGRRPPSETSEIARTEADFYRKEVTCFVSAY
jgi:hypothetical protein